MKLSVYAALTIIAIQTLFAKVYTLDELYKLALKKDPRLSDFQYSYLILKAKLSKVEAAFYPRLSYKLALVPMGRVDTDEPSGSIDDMNFNEWGLGIENKITFVQPIYTFGKWETGLKMAKKRALLELKKSEKLKQKIKFDINRAYQALVMIKELEKITNYGKKQLNKALKYLKKLDEEDSDDYSETDYFKLKIYEQKLKDKENELKSMKNQIRFALIRMLGIEDDFQVKDNKVLKENKPGKFNFENMFEYKMLAEMIKLSELNLKLQKSYFAPDIFFWASWSYKTSTVAKEHSGYDPYHKNIAAAGLGLKWDFDFMTLKAKYKQAKLQLLQNQNRVKLLKTISDIKDYKLKSEVELLEEKIEIKKKIAKESKRWFTGNAMDYYAGIGKAKDLLESLAAYQKAKADVIKAIFDYNIKVESLKLFRFEN